MIALAFVCAVITRAQEPALQYDLVQGVIDGLRTADQAQKLDEFLRGHGDVIISRTDYNMRNLMLQVPHASTLHEAQLNGWLAERGFTLRCYRRVPNNLGPYHPMDPRHCGVPATGH